jgi:transcriptional regulator with XRE-family HTH domain
MSKNKDGSERKVRKDTRKSSFFRKYEDECDNIGRIFGDHLSLARISKGYTQASFSTEIGMELNTYRKYEQGVYRVEDPFFINFLAQKLDVSADYLVGISENTHPDYDEVIKKTGLSPDSISMLQNMHNSDDSEDSLTHNGYLDFINCFLGNQNSTELFFHGLLPQIRELSELLTDNSSLRLEHMLETEITDYIYEYLIKVVVPSFKEQYATGHFNPIDSAAYVQVPTKKEK